MTDQKSFFPKPEQLKGSAAFSPDKTLRFELRCWWTDSPRRLAAWLMVNPSKADGKIWDPTANRVTHFSRAMGCDGWIGVNFGPLVTPDQGAFWRWLDSPESAAAMAENRIHIERAAFAASRKLVAFGAEAMGHPRLADTLELFSQPGSQVGADDRLWCLGVSQNGAPLHPMARGKHRVPDDRKPVLWRMPA